MGFYRKAVTTLCTSLALSVSCLAGFASGNLSRPEGLADGPGIWVNIWNYPQVGRRRILPKSALERGCAIYLYRPRAAIPTPSRTRPSWPPSLKLPHHYKIRVIAWSFSELQNPTADADKLIAAARFTTEHGQRVDAVAANMEKDLSVAKVEPYSAHLRQELGPTYPLVAVVYSPLNHAPQVAKIPWKMLDHYYTVLAPMNYWNSRYQKIDPYTYTIATVQKIRELVGRPDVEIHVIGDGMGTHADSISQFMRACQQAGATSASLYPNFKVTDEQLDTIARYAEFFPVNSRFRLAALHSVLTDGSLDVASNIDPAGSINRGEFYRLVVRGLNVNHASMPPDKAAELLSSLGVLEQAHVNIAKDMSVDDALRAQISSKEAFNVVAAVVNLKANPHAKPLHPHSKRADRWFVQPAFAENSVEDVHFKPLTYLDAAQLVVQARPGVPIAYDNVSVAGLRLPNH